MIRGFLTFSLLSLISSVTIAQWHPTSGPSLGHVNQFFCGNGAIYAATGDYGAGSILKSTDSGRSWRWISYGIPGSPIMTSVLFDGIALYAGTRNGLFVSTNDGDTWKLSLASASVHCIVLYEGGVYFGGLGGSEANLMKTADHGATWQVAGGALPNTSSVNVLYVDGPRLYAGMNGDGIYVSADGALTWQPEATNIPKSDAYIYAFARVENVLLASTPRVIYRSTDGGTNWVEATTGLPESNGANAFGYNGNVVVAGISAYGAYRSMDLGATWVKSDSGLNQSTPTAITTVGNLFVEGSLGIYRSANDGLTWDRSGSGVAGTFIEGIVSTPAGILAGDLDADFGLVWKSNNGGDEWTEASDGLSRIGVNTLTLVGANVLCGTDGDGIFSSSDNGSSWNQVSSFPMNSYVSAVASHGNVAVAGTKGFTMSIYRTTDAGATWDSAHNGISMTDITSVIADGDAFILSQGVEGFSRSTDSGASWQKINAPVDNWPTLLGEYAGYLFATGFQNVYRSADHSATWESMNTGLERRKGLSLLGIGRTLYMGTDTGLFRSQDSGRSWMRDDASPLQKFSINVLATDGSSLYAGTSGAGVWKKSLTTGAVRAAAENAPSGITLNPNPTVGQVTIGYSLSTSGNIRAEIVDELGIVRKSFDAGMQPSGSHKIQLNLGELRGGVYFVRLVGSGVRSAGSKILLLGTTAAR